MSGQQLGLHNHLPLVRDALEDALPPASFELNGRMFVGTPVSVPRFGWVVLVAQPRGEAFRPLLSSLWVLTVSAWWPCRSRSHRVGAGSRPGAAHRLRYADQARAIAGGDHDQPWPITRIREFDNLAGDLERMSVAIRQRERDLATSEARYRSVIDSAPGGHLQFDEHGVFILSEGKGLARVGLAAGEAVGQSCSSCTATIPASATMPVAPSVEKVAVRLANRRNLFRHLFRSRAGSRWPYPGDGRRGGHHRPPASPGGAQESETRLRTAIESIPFDFS
ncbi:MAG: hypothetical protein U1F70_10795 [Candidatus Competibacteraceae bacterium]